MSNRLRISHPFGKRTVPSESIEPNTLYCIAFAGEGKTEYEYFDKIIDKAKELGISKYVKIEPLQTEDENDTKSHPKYVMELLQERKGNPNFGYDPHEIWMVIDRDRQNVKKGQLEEIIKICEQEGYNLALSNPTFELWLLLHITDTNSYNHNELLENKKTGKKRFLEKEIAKLCGGYHKPNIPFEPDSEMIKQAIERAKKLEIDNIELIEKLGTNVCILVEHILKT